MLACFAFVLAGCIHAPAAAGPARVPSDALVPALAVEASGRAGEWTVHFWPMADPPEELDLDWRFAATWAAPEEGHPDAVVWRLGPLPVASGPDGQWLVRPPGGASAEAVRGAGTAEAQGSLHHALGDPAAVFTGVLFGFAATVPWTMRLTASTGTATLAIPSVSTGGGMWAEASPAVGPADSHRVEATVAGPGLRHIQFTGHALQPVGVRSYDLAFADGTRREALVSAEAGVDGAIQQGVGMDSWAYIGHFDARGGNVVATMTAVGAALEPGLVVVSIPVPGTALPGAWKADYEGL